MYCLPYVGELATDERYVLIHDGVVRTVKDHTEAEEWINDYPKGKVFRGRFLMPQRTVGTRSVGDLKNMLRYNLSLECSNFKEIAEKAGVSTPYVSNASKGKSINFDAFVKLCEYCGMKI